MRLKLLTPVMLAMAVLGCLPAMAQGSLAAQGYPATVRGIAHIVRSPEGTYVVLRGPHLKRYIAGFVAFGDDGNFPDLKSLEGRNVQITGVVALDGGAYITMTDPDQLMVVG